MEPLAHASIAFIAKPLIPEAPLWALVAATQVPDLLSFAFLRLASNTALKPKWILPTGCST